MKTLVSKMLPLSTGQQALWYINQLDPKSNAYHLGTCLELRGPLNERALVSAWEEVAMAHPQLRTQFVNSEDGPFAILNEAPPRLEIESGGDMDQYWTKIAENPFDLENEFPVRALVLRRTKEISYLLLCSHHIVSDLWSSAVVLRELSENYKRHIRQAAVHSAAQEKIGYGEFVTAERRWLEGPSGIAAWNFWRGQFHGIDTPPIFTRSMANEKSGDIPILLGGRESEAIRRVAYEQATTPFAVLLACYSYLIRNETRRDDFFIGTAATLRNRAGFRDTVGYFVNSVPIRCPIGKNNGKSIGIIANNARNALKHRSFPFSVLVERTGIPREPETTPVFQSMFAYQSLPRAERNLLPLALGISDESWDFGGGIHVKAVARPAFDGQFPIALILGPQGHRFQGSLQYDGRRITAAQAMRLALRFPETIREFLSRRRAASPNSVRREKVERLEDLFDKSAGRTPNAIAISEGGKDLSYAEVKACADRLAAALNFNFPDCRRPIAIQMSSCAEALITILAVLKSGRAFQSVDIAEPDARRNRALERTNARALITPAGANAGTLPDGVTALDPEKLKLKAFCRPDGIYHQPISAAYLVYTSGSTGEPKAVEVGHPAVVNHARAMIRRFELTSNDRVLQFHTLAFDAAYEEIFPAWVAGACVVVESQAREVGIPAILEKLKECQITVLNIPTSYWHILTSQIGGLDLSFPSSVRLLVVGGEPASAAVYHNWRRLVPACRWINTYGPTEATITALSYEPPADFNLDVIPIGQPIDGVTALMLNDTGQIVSEGEGELIIGGKGLAVGYYRDEKSTAEKFIRLSVGGKMQRFYRTGDLVKCRTDGHFEFLGRIDRQLKIRGYRVEPEEIEKILRSHRCVMDAAVTPVGTNGETALSAWIVSANVRPKERQLRNYLSAHLPAHMVPLHLHFVARLPRKPNGKTDGTALAAGKAIRISHRRSGPKEIAGIFSELLGIRSGTGDNFFVLGGHSLLAIKLLGQIESRFGARIPVSDFVAAATPKALWNKIQAAPASDDVANREILLPETPVTAQQSRALLAHELGESSLANITLLFEVRDSVDERALKDALEQAAQKHFILRAGFLRTDRGIVLRENTIRPELERHTISHRDERMAATDLIKREGKKAFMLDGRFPWFRWLLMSSENSEKSYLGLITHHAVADGWTLELLLENLSCYYRVSSQQYGKLEGRGCDYRIYAVQQSLWLRGEAAQRQKSFWKDRLSGVEELRLPFRLPSAGAGSDWSIKQHKLSLPSTLSRHLRSIAATYGVTPFALMMAGFKSLIHRHSGQNDITLASVVSNRLTQADQNIFGPIQNPVLIRNRVTSDVSMRQFAQKVAASLIEAQANGAYPFEQVMHQISSEHRNQFGRLQFLSYDRSGRTGRLGSAVVRLLEIPAEESPFELSVGVSVATSRIKIGFEYQTTAYRAPGIRCLAEQYVALLEALAKNPGSAVGELNIVPNRDTFIFRQRVSTVRIPNKELLHEGFEYQARINPNRLAILSEDRSLNYGELNMMVESTAHVLREHGLTKEGLVAVLLPKGWEQIVACLAILKCGGVYVPVDPSLPEDRLNAIFRQGKFFGAIVTDTVLGNGAWAKDLRSVITIHSQPKTSTPFRWPRINPNSLAYIVFTSGSTGTPKGVMISHQAAMTTIAEISRRFRIQIDDRVFAISSLNFDLSVFDIFGTLRAGGAVVMAANQDPKVWLAQIHQHGVTVWNSAPCLFDVLLDEAVINGGIPDSLRLILLSGDFISPALARRARILLPHAQLVSLGGATEGSIWSIAREIKQVDASWHRIPYGRALRQQEMFVLDDALNHCAAGVSGELFIAGAGLAKGYWCNRTETRQRFITHPQWKIRLYRTGDRGRYREDGEIEILGRMDEQAKINGIRFEPGEVEAVLRSLPCVREALCEIRIDAEGNKNLVAYVAAEAGTTTTTLSAGAMKTLPPAVMPSKFMVLERFPLTANGKVDRAALCAMKLPMERSTVITPPVNSTEEWISNMWSSMLGGIPVGTDDDFFALGGNSLLAIRMLQRVRAHFASELPLSMVIAHPTVRGIAEAINTMPNAKPELKLRSTTELEPHSEPPRLKHVRRSSKRSHDILITGATGHLGSALLRELLKKNDCNIYCLVRSDSNREADDRLQKSLRSSGVEQKTRQRVSTICGDLGRDQFGWNPMTFDDVAANIRTIYHCAAEVNFISPYEKLAPVNVKGAQEVIRLAAAADAVLNYVSSVAVFPYGQSNVIREDEDITGVRALLGGYAQSKWVAERMVWKSISQGLRAIIYRPAQIIGRPGDSPHDLFEHVLRVCNTLEAIPDIETKMDPVTPEYAAAAIHSLSMQISSIGKAFHLVHPGPITLRDFAKLFPRPLPFVPYDSWVSTLNEQAKRRDDASLLLVSMLARGLGRADLTPPIFDCSRTIAGLKDTNIVCPALDKGFVRRELHWGNKIDKDGIDFSRGLNR